MNENRESIEIGIAQRLKECRKFAKLTLKEASDKLEIAQNTLSQYESAKRSPSVSMIILMSRLYESSINYILLGIREEFATNEREKSVLEAYRKLDDFNKGKVSGIIEASIKK